MQAAQDLTRKEARAIVREAFAAGKFSESKRDDLLKAIRDAPPPESETPKILEDTMPGEVIGALERELPSGACSPCHKSQTSFCDRDPVPVHDQESSGQYQAELFVDAVNAIHGDMRTLLARLPEGKKKAKSTGFSSVGSHEGGALLAHYGFEAANGHELLPLEIPPPGLEFPDFDYSQFPDENAGIDKASAHHCASLARMGVKFGTGGFRMMDVHTRTDLMTLDTDAEDEEAARFRGTTDLLLVPNGTDTRTAPAKASLAVDHKQSFEDKMAYNRAHGKGVPAVAKNAEGQGIMIQLAVCSLSKKPCDVVITDGHNCTLFKLRGKILYTYEHISMTQMYFSVGSWLAAHQEVLAKFSISESDFNRLDSALLEPYRLMVREAADVPMAEQIEVVAHNLPEAAMPAAIASLAQAYIPVCQPMMPEAFHRFYKE